MSKEGKLKIDTSDDFDTINLDDGSVVNNSMDYKKLESESEISTYELLLRGWSKQPGKGNVYRKKKNTPNRYYMTEDAITHCITARLAIVTKSTTQANLSGKDKRSMYDDTVDFYMNAFDKLLMFHGEDWNLSLAQCTMLSEEMEEFLRLVLTRTFDDKERTRGTGITESANLNEESKFSEGFS